MDQARNSGIPRSADRGLVKPRATRVRGSEAWGQFRGQLTAASLKRDNLSVFRREKEQFRGQLTAASLKRACQGSSFGAVAGQFRGQLTAASLKLRHFSQDRDWPINSAVS